MGFLATFPAALLAQSNTSADGYDPNVNGNVYALATQSDGKLVIAGVFSGLQPNGATTLISRGNIARLNGDGTVDSSFDPGANGAINAVAIQLDGKIVIGGAFTSVGGSSRNRIARLNADGSVDSSFNFSLGDQLSDVQVMAIAIQQDGKIVVGGNFVATKATGGSTGLNRDRLLRLNTDGSIDNSFTPNPNNAVYAIAIQPSDGRILIGGTFTSVAGTTRNRVARLELSGSVDGNFDPNANNTVNSLLVLPNNKIMIGGTFTAFGASATHSCLARLNDNGNADETFISGANGQVAAIARQRDGRLIVGGAFTQLWPALGTGRTESRAYIGRFSADGTVDPTFAPTPNGATGVGGQVQVRAIVAQSDGGVVFGGLFTQIRPPNAPFATNRNHIARVYAGGSPDVAFDLGSGGAVMVAVQDSDGKFLIGGTFNTVGGSTRNFLARVNADGSLDSSFNPTVDGRVTTIALQSDKKILIGGTFTQVNSTSRNFFARLNANGSLDTDFNPNANSGVNAIVVQSDQKILLGGAFTAFTPNGGTTTTNRQYLARINSDGTVDTSYTAIPNQPVLALKLQSDSKLIVAGSFAQIQPTGTTAVTTRNGIARLNADGTLDAGYNPNPSGVVNALAIQSDGKLIAAGGFLSVQANGATSSTSRYRIARFNTDGSLDMNFNPDANGLVGAIAIQSNGQVLVSGGLTSIGGHTITSGLGRINTDGSSDFTFEPNPNGRALVLLPLSNGKILFGGTFSTYQKNASTAAKQVSRLVLVDNTGTIDTGFNPAIGGQNGTQVNTVALQADGKVILGGNFSNLGGSSGGGIARFFPDGVADQTFSPSADGAINTLVVRPDVGSVITQGNGFAWINSDGTLRTGFGTDANARIVGEVRTVARQNDGKILIGGVFSNASGATGSNLARFNADGTLDTSFNPGPNGPVNTLVVQPDGKILVGGAFATLSGVTRNRIARLNLDGSTDSFDPNLNGGVNAIVVLADGKILIGGGFTTVQPNSATSATGRPYVARLNSDGGLDTGFTPIPNAEVLSLAVQSDGQIILGGSFTTVQGTGSTTASNRLNLARVKSDGTLDNFDPNHASASGPVFAIVVQSDSKIIVGGSFAQIGGIAHSNIARMGSDGNLDVAFGVAANGSVSTLALDSNGKILVGGAFTTIAGSARNRLARLNSDSSLDTSFNPNANSQVDKIVLVDDGSILLSGSFSTLQPGGAIVAGGSFSNVGGAVVNNLVFLNDDGTPNTAIKPDPNGAVNAAVVQGDGKIVVGGAFTSLSGSVRNRLARLNANGTLDTAFNPNLNGTVVSLALQADGKLLVGGDFTVISGGGRPGIARLNVDGSLDGTFNPAGGLGANAIAVQADGRVVVVRNGSGVRSILSRINADGSDDASFAAQTNAQLISTLALQADGKVLVGGAFTTIAGGSRNRLARLNADGSLDSSFDPNVDNTVNAIALQQDGKLVIGGTFGQVSGNPRVRVARISNSTPAVQTLTAQSFFGIVWTRDGSSPELASATFEYSTDARIWTTLGAATRIVGTSSWRLNASSALPATTFFYLRARGVVPTTQGGSQGVIEQTAQVYLNSSGVSASPLIASATLGADSLAAVISDAPQVSALLKASNSGGTMTDTLVSAITSDVVGNVSSSGHLPYLSCLTYVDASSPLVTGFVVTGNTSKGVLLRAIGPGLANLDVSGALPTPRVQLYSADGQRLLDSSSSGGNESLAALFNAVGASPISPSSADAAAATTLAPGGYTAVTDNSGTSAGGVVLSEIYDIAGGANQFAAMSARGVIVNGGSLTGGFVVSGDAPRRFLVRGVGPALGSQGVSNGVADPVLTVNDLQGREYARNDNWETPVAGGASGTEIAAAAASIGTYGFANGSKDAAVIVTLAPGIYTAQVTANGTGASAIEFFELP